MKNELLEKNTTRQTFAALNRNPRLTRTPAPDVFRRQEPFWKEVRKRIVEKNPAVLEVAERLF